MADPYGARGSQPPALPVGGGLREDRLRLRKAQAKYWNDEAAEWRTSLKEQGRQMQKELAERRAWWKLWGVEQRAAWTSRGRKRGNTVADFPLLQAQWPPDGLSASSVSTGDSTAYDWVRGLSPDKHRFRSAAKDRALKGTACPNCLELGLIGDVDALRTQLVHVVDEIVGLSDNQKLFWCHPTWSLDPKSGEWFEANHVFKAPTKPRFQQSQWCLVCCGSVVGPTTSLRTWHPELADELADTPTSLPEQLSCTDRETMHNWQCPHGHEYLASILNRVNGTGCPRCKSKTSRVQARLAAELLHTVGIRLRHDRDPRLPDGVPDLNSYRHPLTPEEQKRFGRRYAYEEIDILLELPGGPVAVEYDGEAFHGQLYRDGRPGEVRKEEILAHLELRLVRVREGKLPPVVAPGVVSVAVTPTTPPFQIALAVLKGARDSFNLEIPSLVGYERHGKALGTADAKEFLAAIRNVPRPRRRLDPKPHRPRLPRHVYPIGFPVGEKWTVIGPPIHQEGREGRGDSWVYEVLCTCGRTRILDQWTITHQPPKTCRHPQSPLI